MQRMPISSSFHMRWYILVYDMLTGVRADTIDLVDVLEEARLPSTRSRVLEMVVGLLLRG
ncbi:MAG: hypothetical protein IPI24_02130 [Ignavibacteria bacterium]|nr:hypothetical protein [Ignavibacteria bacterium]